jgi:hypothetical protein
MKGASAAALLGLLVLQTGALIVLLLVLQTAALIAAAGNCRLTAAGTIRACC